MNLKYIFLQCFVIFFFSFCTNAAERIMPPSASTPPVLNTTTAIEGDTSLSAFKKFIIDTTIEYPTIDSLLALRNRQGQKLWEYGKVFIRTSKRPDAEYIVDSVQQYENEIFLVALYKHLLRLPKVITAFNLYRGITYSNMIPDGNKMALFEMYPASMRQSPLGKKYLAALTAKGKNVGINIDAVSNNRITDKEGQTVSFSELLNNGHTYTLLIVGASWCSPCRHQDIILDKLVVQGKVDTGKTRILFFSIDSKRTGWESYVAGFPKGTDVFLLADGLNSPLLKKFAVPGVPYYLLLDNRRNILIEGNHLKDVMPKIAPGVSINSFF